MGGTGKYERMVLSGTIEMVKPAPTPQPGTRTVEYCNRNAGTYRTK